VYLVAGTPRTWTQGLVAVLLAVDGAVASHGSAGRLYGLRVDSPRYEITTDRSRQVVLPGVGAHRSVLWSPDDRRRRDRIAVTSPARLAVDLSGRLSAKELGALVDDLLRRKLLRIPELALCAGRLRSGTGRRPSVVHEVLRARCAGYQVGDSDLEVKVLVALAAAGLPRPNSQHHIRVDGRRYRIDLAYPRSSIAIEIDSWAYHRWRSTFDSDRARRNDLTLAGYTVLQVTDGMTDADIVRFVQGALTMLADSKAS
jgi:very-short-patch-repair endonuclease